MKYFRGWLKAHRLLKNDSLKYAKVYTQALNEVGDKAKLSYMKSVVKKLKTDVFISMATKEYLNDMAGTTIFAQPSISWFRSNRKRRPSPI